jgi:NAD(P)-dependent dehydrogenase (short-subunit alcohol dehydrogenase family)
VRNEEDVRRFVASAVERFETIHIAFNPGVVFGLGEISGAAPLANLDTAEFDDVWATDGRGLFLSITWRACRATVGSRGSGPTR